MWADLAHRLRAIFRRDAVERGLDGELRHHLDLQADRYVSAGWTREAALRQACLDVGGVDQIREEHRDARGTRALEDFWRDVRVGIRLLRRAPLFSATAIITVALGVGLNTIVFSFVEALVLRPLPVTQPENLWFVQGRVAHSFPMYRELRDRNRTFAALAGYRITMMHVETPQGPAHAWGYLATGSYFDLLGVQPHRGRFFQAADDVVPGSSPHAVLSYDYWRTALGASDAAIGTTIRINRQPYTVLGVAPPGFHGTEVLYRPSVWVPMMMQAQIEIGNPWLDNPNTTNTFVIGRLASEITRAQAEDDLNALQRLVAREQFGAVANPVPIHLVRPGLLGDVLGGPARAFGVGLLALAGLVLLAACANLAGGLAARGADRRRELAVRVAIGAGRGRLMRQLLTETLVLVGVGGAVGAGGAALAAAVMSRWQPPIGLPVQLDAVIDWRVALFASLATIATGLGIGIGPALQAVRADVHASLSVREATVGRRWPLRDLLVSVQVAICVLLVAGSLLAGRGLQNAMQMPIGMHASGVTTASFDLGLAGHSRAVSDALRQQMLDRLRSQPGVQQAAYANSIPLNIDQSTTRAYAADEPEPTTGEGATAVRYQVSPEFFQVLGIRMLAGRDFTGRDTAGSQRVAIINEAFAARIFGRSDAIGRPIRFGPGGQAHVVIGIVETGKYQTLTEAPTAAVYLPMLQSPNTMTMMLVRSTQSASEAAEMMRSVVREADPSLPIMNVRSMDDLLGVVRLPMQAAALALAAFGILAATLAATGIHGVVAYAVSRRRRELALRIALGATRRSLVHLVLRRTVMLVVAGVVAGIVLVAMSRPVLASVLYVPPTESGWSWLLVLLLVTIVSAVACAWPMWRAMRVDPASALAAE